jgi:hypothetical protein
MSPTVLLRANDWKFVVEGADVKGSFVVTP